MILHDVLAQMLYEDEKRKLNFINLKGWQLYGEKNKPTVTPSQIKTVIQVKQHQCETC